ncbi:MAG: hypothetical protein ACK4OF_04375 [Aquificaceae bacterium]
MIKINLAKEKKEKKLFPVLDLKGFKLQNLLKAGGEYYIGLVPWIILIAILAYFFKVNGEVATFKEELDRLSQEKTNLQARAQKFLEERKILEEGINQLKKQIEDLEKSKDIVIGLKEYYGVFNASLDFYTSYIPKDSWISTYRQTLDINQEILKTDMDLNSFDYQSISSYGSILGKNSQEIMISPVGRKLNPNGFEYYSAKLNAEKSIREER